MNRSGTRFVQRCEETTMVNDLRWANEGTLPDDVRAVMRDMIADALRKVAREADPGDGSMIILSIDRRIGRGMWDGGWKLQASFVEDVRFNRCPFVVVHAYQASQVAKGSVAADVVRTKEDLRILARGRLKEMISRREVLDAEIEQLRSELEAGANG